MKSTPFIDIDPNKKTVQRSVNVPIVPSQGVLSETKQYIQDLSDPFG